MILMTKKAIPIVSADGVDVAVRIALQTLASRGSDYASEVRRLIDAGREVMRRNGTESRAKVADIVAAAGVSNDAFYRHFASKEALVAAILEDGTQRLASYLGHQMAKARTPEGEVRAWVDGILAQAVDEDSATTTLAVLWNAGSTGDRRARPGPVLAALVIDAFAALGSADPDLHAALAAHATIGTLNDYLWQGDPPSSAVTDRLVTYFLSAMTP